MKDKSIRLFASDGNHNLQYEGKCKLTIDRISYMLIVEPEHEECKIKSAKFECGFVMNTNVLFVITEQELNDFVLIFDEETRCKKVYDLIMEDKTQCDVKEDVLFDRFLIKLCNRFTQTDDATVKLKEVVAQLMDKQVYENQTKKYTTALNDASDLLYSSTSATSSSNMTFFECGDQDTEKSYIQRKRRHSQLDGIHIPADDGDILEQTRTYVQTVNQELYKLIYIKSGMYIRQRLFIFTNASKNHCFEYSLSQPRKLYYCIGCESLGKDVTAIFDKDENGSECIKIVDKEHVCTPIPYTPENYIEMKSFVKPDYRIYGNSNTASGMMLIIFAKNNRSRCWEFQAAKTKSLFSCCKCNTSAKVLNMNTKNEYVELTGASHACEYIQFVPDKYYQFSDDLSTDFEVQRYIINGQEKKRLIIFDKTDRKLCYKYTCNNRKNFKCLGCRASGIHVAARLLQTPNGKECVIFSKRKHVCELRPYVEEVIKEEIILHPPDFELMENTGNGTKKLFVFDSNDRNLCYMFAFHKHSRQKYYCQGCANKQRYKGSNVKKITATLCKDKDGEYYVRLNDSKHACQPRKYEPQKYAKKEFQKCYDYFFFRLKKFKTSVNVAIHHPEDKTLCYQFLRKKDIFRCIRCDIKRKYFQIKIEKDADEKEYFNHDYKKHACEPINVSSICAPKFVILSRDEIHFDEKKKKKLEIDESRIVKSSNFELCPNQKGVPDASLLIYNSHDLNIGYKYSYRNDRTYYICCKSSCCASAKLQIQDNGEMYVVLGKGEHKCNPITFIKT